MHTIRSVVPWQAARDIFLAAIVGGFIAYSVTVAVHSEQVGQLLVIAGVAMACGVVGVNYRCALLLAVFCLPFTQVPTLKFFLRWRIGEVIAWLLLPWHLVRHSQGVRRLSQTGRCYVVALVVYASYTGLVGIARSWFVEAEVEVSLDYFIHPLFRTGLETARLLAAISLVVGVLHTIEGYRGLQRLLGLVVWSGAVAAAYGVYQSIALWIGLPLLPETLWHEGYLRPFGTFYEPTGLGSFTAATTLLALFFLFYKRRKWIWAACLLLNLAGLMFSLSRAGLAGLGAGLCLFGVLSLLGRRARSVVTGVVAPAIVVAGLGLAYEGATRLMGESTVALSLSEQWLWQTGQSRIDAYTQLVGWMRDFPTGMGQGLFIFSGGGLPGLARLLVEGGVVGIVALAFLHAAVARSLMSLWHSGATRSMASFLAAAYVSSLVTTINYINTTDMWIWFFWALPVIAWQAVGGHQTTRHEEI